MPEQRTVVVLGMHRSGTSALTGALVEAGICPGDTSTMYGAAADNEKGFYEQRELVDINEALLLEQFLKENPDLSDYGCGDDAFARASGQGWLLGGWLREAMSPGNDTQNTRRIGAFLQGLYSHASPHHQYIIKDPRLSLTFPLWRGLVSNPLLILMVRKPAAVANSLWKRNRLYPGASHTLWTSYTHAALQNAAHCPVCVIDYDELIERPSDTIRVALDWLAGRGVVVEPAMLDKAMAFIEPDMRHQRAEVARAPDRAQGLYDALRQSMPAHPDVADLQRFEPGRFCPWQSALYVMARSLFRQAEADLNEAAAAYQRLVQHPVAGAVIRLLARIKRDESFGTFPVRRTPDQT